MGDIIDINVQVAVDEVNIIANPNNYVININRIIGEQVQSDWTQTDNQAPDYIKNKPSIPTLTSDLTNDGEDGINPFITANDVTPQVNSDWNATSGVAEILNKPTIPAAVTNTSELINDGEDGVNPFITAADLPSTVTSVGLTMPSAFSVANSPITSAGTLAVTGAGVVSQYVRGDGSLANFPTSTGGGASVSYYLNGSVSQGTIGGVSYKEMNSVPIIGTGTDFNINADGYIAQFITDVGDPNKLLIPAGNWNFETYFSASSGGGSPRFYIELYKYDGSTFTLISSNSATPENITGGTSIDLYFTALAIPQTTLLATDRLAVRFYVIHSGRTITMHTENSHLSQIITTFSTGLTALNGLTTQVQSFATGTSGTDFGISSATSTHTFNLPTASATNRGALSTTDWTTFNGKFNLPSLTSGSVLFSDGTTIAQDNANFFWDNTNKRLNIGGITSNTSQFGIKAQGGGSSNIALRVRNTADSLDLLTMAGDGTLFVRALIKLGGNTDNISASSNSGFLDINTNTGIKMNPGSAFSTLFHSTGNVLIGTTVNNGGKLQIKAGGALSTDIALRVRNSVDSADLMTLGGTGTLNVNGVITTNAGNNVLALNLIGTTSSIQATPSSLRSNIIVNSQSVNAAIYTNAGSFSAGIPSGVSFGSTTSGAKNTFGSLVTTGGGGIYMNFSTNGAESGFHITHNFGSDLMAVTSGGNVLINTATDIPSSKLTIESTTQGVLFPRMTTTQKNAIASPATGLVVYDTTLGKLCVRGAAAWETITSI